METNKSQYTEHVQFNPQDLLAERGKTRASFFHVAQLAQHLKSDYHTFASDHRSDVEEEAVDMILTKLARIATAKKFDLDSWQDIAGYATLVINEANKYNE